MYLINNQDDGQIVASFQIDPHQFEMATDNP